MKTKLCPRCGVKKRVELFGNQASSKDGLTAFCKVCIKDTLNISYCMGLEKHRAQCDECKRLPRSAKTENASHWINHLRLEQYAVCPRFLEIQKSGPRT